MSAFPVEIGSQLFINQGDTPDQIRKWVRQMKDSHLKLIRLFVTWSLVEPMTGRWDFRQFDACFEEAEAQGLKIIPTLSAESTPGWMKENLGFQEPRDIDNDAIWKQSLNYVRKIVERYHLSPALHSWILWNEPGYRVAHNDNGRRAYARYLATAYEDDIKFLNEVYASSFTSFEKAAEARIHAGEAAAFSPYPDRLDWIRFSVAHLVGKLSEIKAEIRKLDKDHPVHVNPHNVSQCILDSGQSVWAEAEIVDFIGCSAHPSWHSTRFLPGRLHQSVALFADMMKSTTRHPEGLFWVTELQGGTNIYSGVNYLCPTGDEIRQWLWTSLGTGARSAVFWCFNARTGGFEGGEWGLLDQRGLPSERLQAAAEVARVIADNQALFDQSRPVEPEVWILHSEHTGALGLIEGSGDPGVENPRNKQMASDALCGAYLLCADLGLTIQFINEDRLVSQGLPKGAILLLPGATALNLETCQAIETHVRAGGRIIADGLVGYKDKNGFTMQENRRVIDEIFSAPLEDIQAFKRCDIHPAAGGPAFEGWFFRCIFDLSAEKAQKVEDGSVLARFTDGKAAVLRRPYHKGTAIRIGTTFFQRYFARPNPEHITFFKALLPKIERPVELINVSPRLQLKRLKSKQAEILILINTAEGITARLRFTRDGTLEGLNGKLHIEYQPGEEVKIDIPAEGVIVCKMV
jgi:beta-galactosidase